MEPSLNVWNVTEQLLQSRMIKIYSEINIDVAREVNSLLDVLNNDNSELPIKLEICSPGGDVLSGLSIIDKIKEIQSPVIAFNTGLCMSMGTAICAACDFAYGSEDAQFMIHEVSSGCEGKFRDMKNSINFTEDLNKRVLTIIAKKCNKTYEEVFKDCERDLYLTAVEAREYGLIDLVTPQPKKNLSALKEFVNALNKTAKK